MSVQLLVPELMPKVWLPKIPLVVAASTCMMPVCFPKSIDPRPQPAMPYPAMLVLFATAGCMLASGACAAAGDAPAARNAIPETTNAIVLMFMLVVSSSLTLFDRHRFRGSEPLRSASWYSPARERAGEIGLPRQRFRAG